MVDSVGNRPFNVGASIGRVGRVDVARAVAVPVRAEARPPATGLRAMARDLAVAPPVDGDRVSRIRRAIADGTFPIAPATIADRLLAFKLNWNGDEQA